MFVPLSCFWGTFQWYLSLIPRQGHSERPKAFCPILWRTISLAVTILNYVFVFAKFLTLSFNVQHPLANMWMRLKMGSIPSILPKTNCWSRENDDNPWGFPWGFPLCLSQFTMVFPYFSMVFPCFAVVFPWFSMYHRPSRASPGSPHPQPTDPLKTNPRDSGNSRPAGIPLGSVHSVFPTETKWCPRSIAKLVNITPITMVYGTQITIVIVTGVYKPTYNLGGTTLKIWGFPWGKPMAMGISQASLGWLKISMGKYPTKMIFWDILYWLVVCLALWKIMEFVKWDDELPKIWKIKFTFQTTNQ